MPILYEKYKYLTNKGSVTVTQNSLGYYAVRSERITRIVIVVWFGEDGM